MDATALRSSPLFEGLSDAELARCFFDRYLDTTHRHIRLVFCMGGEKLAVIHLVDVIAAQYQNLGWRVRSNDVQVLVNGVRRATVPLAANALRCWQYIHELPSACLQERPAVHKMADQ